MIYAVILAQKVLASLRATVKSNVNAPISYHLIKLNVFPSVQPVNILTELEVCAIQNAQVCFHMISLVLVVLIYAVSKSFLSKINCVNATSVTFKRCQTVELLSVYPHVRLLNISKRVNANVLMVLNLIQIPTPVNVLVVRFYQLMPLNV